jgi:hypothetical protein
MPEETIIDIGKPDLPKIEMMYAYIASDAGSEGICAFHSPNGWMPMVGPDMKRIKSLRPMAEKIAKATGQTIKLVRFHLREELEVITG